MDARLCHAIEQRQMLYTCYKDGQLRLIEPHCYWETAFGQPLLRAFQISGYSLSGQPRGWKCFRVNEILAFDPTGHHFDGPREGYHPFGQSSMGELFAMIPPDLPEWLTAA